MPATCDMIESGNLTMDQDTGVIYRNIWTDLGEDGQEWEDREAIDDWSVESCEQADFDYLRDIWEDGERNTIDDY